MSKPHAIMIAFPFQGHLAPFINLAIKLASKGFIITFVHIEYIHDMLSESQGSISQPDLFSEARESGLDIRYTTIEDGFPPEFDRVANGIQFWETMFQEFPGRVDEFVGKTIQANPSSTHFLIADTMYTWPAFIADKHNLVNVSLWTEPALVFSLVYHIDLLKENGHFPCKDHAEEVINYLPGIESINTKDLMPYMKEAEASTLTQKIMSMAFEQVKKADFVLHNTVHEFESETLSALNKIHPSYAVGPINFTATNTVSKSLWSQTDCTQWLDSKPPGSVLYVSFGSIVQIDEKLIQEIAHGLLLSEVNFVWAVREGIDKALPVGFRDEAKDKGLVVSWCNQIKVLSNQAVGGFLTHCGWNSILESMWCGVPMICSPITYDQPTNKKLVVDDWKIGINLCDGTSVDRTEAAETIKELMNGTSGKGLRHEANKVKETFHRALETDGSSEKNFDQFVQDLKAKLIAGN